MIRQFSVPVAKQVSDVSCSTCSYGAACLSLQVIQTGSPPSTGWIVRHQKLWNQNFKGKVILIEHKNSKIAKDRVSAEGTILKLKSTVYNPGDRDQIYICIR